jgi:hypothetical protein
MPFSTALVQSMTIFPASAPVSAQHRVEGRVGHREHHHLRVLRCVGDACDLCTDLLCELDELRIVGLARPEDHTVSLLGPCAPEARADVSTSEDGDLHAFSSCAHARLEG